MAKAVKPMTIKKPVKPVKPGKANKPMGKSGPIFKAKNY